MNFFYRFWRFLIAILNNWSWMAFFAYLTLGIACLNIFNNYNAQYTYFPGDGAASARVAPIGTPGDGAAASNSGRIGAPGDGAAASSSGRIGTPGGSSGGVMLSPAVAPGGFESSYDYIFVINFIYLSFAILGALVGGIITRTYYLLRRPNNSNIFYYSLLMAFLCSRAFLYIVAFIIDIIIHSSMIN